MTNKQYTEDSIETLDARNHVRLRSGMYIGSNANPNQLMLEIFSNALDEHNIGHGNCICVGIFKDGYCYVRDRGQGFLVNSKRDDGKTVLEAAFSVVNTSGKFKDDGVYEGSSLGLNGLGAKLTNFLSEFLTVVTMRDGEIETIYFENGLFKSREVNTQYKGQVHDSGTTVSWKPDPQFFQSEITDVEYFRKFFSDMCCMCPGLCIELETNDGIETIRRSGINDFVTSRLGNAIEIIGNRFVMDSKSTSIGLTFTSNSDSKIIAYVNYGLTDSGPHITSIKSSITRILNSWARENGLLKEKEKNLDGNSIQEGLLFICNIVSTGVTYNSQTKEKVVSLDSNFIDDFNQQFEVWLDNNPDDARIIIDKAITARKAAEAAKKAREAVKNKANKKDKVFKLPTTLTDCWTKNREKAELFICEGTSAATGLVAGRNSEFQAVYGVRGKMLSILKTKRENIIKNQEINNIIQALGLDYNPKTAKCIYDKNKLRYGKIIAAADAK